MPEVKHYKVTASVEFDVRGPYAYAEAVALAEERLARLNVPGDNKTINGVYQAKVASLTAEKS